MELWFVRHAQKEKNIIDPDLTSKGIKQVNYLVKKIKKESIDEIYCSDLKRAIHTAVIIGRKKHLKPKISSALREFDVKVLKTPYSKWNKNLKEQYLILKDFLKNITKNPNSNKRILIVAHGNTNRLILAILLELNLNNLVRFEQLETAFNRIYWLDKFKNWRLGDWNNMEHLPKKLLFKDNF